MLNFNGQHGFIELALEAAFAGQKEVAGNLHGDGTRAFFRAAGHIVNCGTKDAFGIDTAVLVKTDIFNGNHGRFHVFGDVGDIHKGATLFAVLG